MDVLRTEDLSGFNGDVLHSFVSLYTGRRANPHTPPVCGWRGFLFMAKDFLDLGHCLRRPQTKQKGDELKTEFRLDPFANRA